MNSILPPTTDMQDQRCREFLGILKGWCPELAKRVVLDAPVCLAHASSRFAYEAELPVNKRTGF